MQNLSATTRMSSNINRLVAHLHLARSEAVRRGLKMTLCPSFDGKSRLDSIEWQRGCVIFENMDGDGKKDANEKILRFIRETDDTILIRSSTSENGRKAITYQPSGMAWGSAATFTFCDRQNRAAPRAVIIHNSGRPHLSKTRSSAKPIFCPAS